MALVLAVTKGAGMSSGDETQIRRGTPAFHATVLALLAAGFSTFAVLYCTQPLMPLLAREFGLSAAVSALSLSVCTGVLAPAMLIAGPLSDARGRKPMMVAGLFSCACLTILSGFLPSWDELLLVRGLQGLVLSGVTAVAMAYVAEEMHPSAIGLAMGLYIGGNAMGGMSGRLFTGVFADLTSWRIAMSATGCLALICAAITWRVLPPSRHFRSRALRLANVPSQLIATLSDPGLRLLYLAGFVLMGGFVSIYNYAAFRLLAPPYELSQAAVGAIFSLYVLGTAGSSLAGWASARLPRRILLPSSVGIMLLGVLLTISNPLALVISGIATITFGFFAAHSLLSSWVGRRAGAAKGSASALYLLFYYAGSSLLGWVGGLFWSAAGWSGVAGFVGALALLGLGASLALARLHE